MLKVRLKGRFWLAANYMTARLLYIICFLLYKYVNSFLKLGEKASLNWLIYCLFLGRYPKPRWFGNTPHIRQIPKELAISSWTLACSWHGGWTLNVGQSGRFPSVVLQRLGCLVLSPTCQVLVCLNRAVPRLYVRPCCARPASSISKSCASSQLVYWYLMSQGIWN